MEREGDGCAHDDHQEDGGDAHGNRGDGDETRRERSEEKKRDVKDRIFVNEARAQYDATGAATETGTSRGNVDSSSGIQLQKMTSLLMQSPSKHL